ncbi:MAG: bifunctional phosphoribosylaminoimidazolecarboxamide formyltransferase/IMP cyclohydrolase [Candidatus Cloacimonadales bacterium]
MNKRALISLSDKTNVVPFAKKLKELGYDIVSSGGTAQFLTDNGVEVIKVSDVTQFPEIMDGRVKTLNPFIHGGILANREVPAHLEQAAKLKINLIDIVCVNLYPFKKTLQNPDATQQELIENIDIGGPTLIRSAAKNYQSVFVVTDLNDYDKVIEVLASGDNSLEFRQHLAQKAFMHTADYDTAIANYFMKLNDDSAQLNISEPLQETLRYGENPHQEAQFFQEKGYIKLLHGKQLSYNNLLDIDSALKTIIKFKSKPTVAIFKHTNPCGIGSDKTLATAYQKAFATDTLSPFGGIVIVNRSLCMETAREINKIFTEIVLAPEYQPGVLEFLQKKKNRRLISFDEQGVFELKNKKSLVSCMNGYLVQDIDIDRDNEEQWQVVTKRMPTDSELEALKFGWNAVASLKSNAVAFTSQDRTLGLGIGQTSRIDSTEIAIRKSKNFSLTLQGSVCASDGFFPFRDSIDELVKHGVTAVIQPGGSKGDPEVIEACDEHNIAMIMTGTRHFRH